MKVKKCNKFMSNFFDKEKYFVHIRTLKETLSHKLPLKKANRKIKFNRKA